MSARVGGREVSLEEAIAAGAALLTRARHPLVYGLVGSTLEAQREAVRLARRLSAALDSAASPAHADSLAAFQSKGALSTTLGELRRRADVVVFWGIDPDTIEPGFVARFSPPRPGRVRVAVDVGDARGPAGVEERLVLPARREIEGLLALRTLLRGRRLDPAATGPLGLPLDGIRSLARRLAGCAYGVLVSDGDPVPARRDPLRAPLLGALPRDARARARLRTLLVRRDRNSVGAENVCTWLAGFPGSLRFVGGEARFDPLHASAEALLAARAVDAALVVGCDPAQYLSAAAQAGLARIPTVRVGGAPAGDVFFQTAALDATPGHLFRMDGVALFRRPDPGPLPLEADILARLLCAMGESAGAA